MSQTVVSSMSQELIFCVGFYIFTSYVMHSCFYCTYEIKMAYDA